MGVYNIYPMDKFPNNYHPLVLLHCKTTMTMKYG